MSGIAGLVYADRRRVHPQDVESMGEALLHRGPDRGSVWTGESAGLVHRMLCTTPESLNEILPLESTPFVITADARLDNRDELLPQLGLSAAVPDSTIILKAFETWGESCPEKLVGDFAFAVWDSARRRLFCARDGLGTRPFFYAPTPDGGWAFASEIRGLFAAGVARRVEEHFLVRQRECDWSDPSLTAFKDIRRLPPGSSVTVDEHGIRFRVYWRPDPSKEIRLSSDEAYVEAFLELFRRAVRDRLRCSGPVGAMLSGGMDSSSVVAMARSLLPTSRLSTFSAVSEDRATCPEYPFVRDVIAQGGLDPVVIGAEKADDYSDDLAHVLLHSDEPVDAHYLFLSRIMHAEARRRGVRVLLDGADGDVVVSQNHHYLAYRLRESGWGACLKEISRRADVLGRTRIRVLIQSCLGPILVRRLHASSRECQGSFLASGDISFGLELYDRSASRLSLESRHPFFDKRLVEFCLAVPTEQKIGSGWPKWLLRRAMADLLPESVRWRKDKSSVTAPFRDRMIGSVLERIKAPKLDWNSCVVRMWLQRNAAQIEKTMDLICPVMR